jgi:hypothetical protein
MGCNLTEASKDPCLHRRLLLFVYIENSPVGGMYFRNALCYILFAAAWDVSIKSGGPHRHSSGSLES